jgi:transcriptional regulator with XRE-family HTH domain
LRFVKSLFILNGMNWKNIIAELQALGATQAEIAERIGKTQAWVSSIAKDKIGDLRYSDGNELLKLLDELRVKKAA